MATWTNEELDRIGNAEELQLTSLRDDGSPRPYVTMRVVRAGDDVYVRSAGGPRPALVSPGEGQRRRPHPRRWRRT